MVPSSGETITYVTELCHSESTGLLKVSIEFKKLQTEKTAIDDLITATTTEMEQIDIELAVAVVAGEKANATTIRARAKEAKAVRKGKDTGANAAAGDSSASPEPGGSRAEACAYCRATGVKLMVCSRCRCAPRARGVLRLFDKTYFRSIHS